MLSGAVCYWLVKEIPNLVVGSGVSCFFLKKNSSFGYKDLLCKTCSYANPCWRIWNYQLASGHSPVLDQLLATGLGYCQHQMLQAVQCEIMVKCVLWWQLLLCTQARKYWLSGSETLGICDKEMLCVSVFDNKFLNIGNAIGASGQTYCKDCKWLINFAF